MSERSYHGATSRSFVIGEYNVGMACYSLMDPLSNADDWLRVWRGRGERCHNACLVQTARWGGGSVVVWGGISYHHRTALHVCRDGMNAIYYRNAVWRNHVIPFFHQHRNMHTSEYARQRLRAHSTCYNTVSREQ